MNDAPNRPCLKCGRILHTGEARILVAFTTRELVEMIEDTQSFDLRARLLCALGLLDPEKEKELQ